VLERLKRPVSVERSGSRTIVLGSLGTIMVMALLLGRVVGDAATERTLPYQQAISPVASEVTRALASLAEVEVLGLRRTADLSVAVRARRILTSAESMLKDAARELGEIMPPEVLRTTQDELRVNLENLALQLATPIRTLRVGLLLIAANMVQVLPQPLKIQNELATLRRVG
jgi:hypothetical protein